METSNAVAARSITKAKVLLQEGKTLIEVAAEIDIPERALRMLLERDVSSRTIPLTKDA